MVSPPPAGKDVWQFTTVESILTNEKYKGSALLQKKYTVDFLSKRMKPNEGEVPQYYVENSHPAIIQPEKWELVQTELRRRKDLGKRHNCLSPFSAKLACADCGEYFGSKVWHSTDKYRRTIWQCNAKFKGESKCTTPHLYEEDIRRAFIQALSKLYADREPILADCRDMQTLLTDCTQTDAEAEETRCEMEVVKGLIQKLIEDNATQPLDQTEYRKRYETYTERFETLQERYTGLVAEHEARQAKADTIGGFMFELRELDVLPLAFSEKLWYSLVDHARLSSGRTVGVSKQQLCGEQFSICKRERIEIRLWQNS